MYEFISGRHPVLSVLRNPMRKSTKLFIQNNLPKAAVLEQMITTAQQNGVETKHISRNTLEKKFSQTSRSHQGVVLISSPYPYTDLDDIIAEMSRRDISATTKTPFLLILDHIQDPHNLGALIRTAELAGCDAVIIPQDRSCEVTPTVVKTSAGASELIPIVQVVNLNRTIDRLKDLFVTIIGLETGGSKNIYELDLQTPLALIVGSEGKGMAQLTQKKCDILTEIPMYGKTASLNASVAGAIAMFEIVRQRIKL